MSIASSAQKALRKLPVVVLAFANEFVDGKYLPSLSKEMKALLSNFESAQQRGKCFLKVIPAATADEIVEVFQDEWYQGRIRVFHYAGHADNDELWLETEDGANQSFFSIGLARFLSVQEGLRLVFLNGCATKDQGDLLVSKGIPVVIGTSREIEDAMALTFADVFYNGLAQGASIEESFQESVGNIEASIGHDFSNHAATRGLFWEGKSEENLPPWRLFSGEGNDFFPVQWRLFYQLTEKQKRQPIDDDDWVGKVISNYRIEEHLGTGSFGPVYKAVHVNLNQEVAIKISHEIIEGYDNLKRIIYIGNQGLKSLDHQNVVKVYDVGELEERGQKRIYIIMELVKGKSLDKLDFDIPSLKPKEWDQLVEFALHLCEGIKSAHKTDFTDIDGLPREGIIHGNLKIKKVLFTPEGVPKITGFMFTDFTRNKQIVLKIPEEVEEKSRQENLSNFFPPEVLDGSVAVNRQTDVFGLGAIFLQVVTGKPLSELEYGSEPALMNILLKRNRSFPKFLTKVIFTATHPDPSKRYESVDKMIAELLNTKGLWGKVLYSLFKK
ncbi:MAG: protein kinase [Bacteroidota bacterium]